MTTEVIPTSTTEATYEQRTAMDGKDYILSFQWNQREGRWYVDILTEDRTALMCGYKLEPNQNIIRILTGELAPPGWLAVLDMQSLGGETPRTPRAPAFDELGGRVKLIYTEIEDFENA